MATTNYNQVIVGDIDITETYRKLMVASTGQDSIYIKAKETLVDYYTNSSGLTDSQKSTMLSQAIVDMSKEISNSAMQMALKIDTENRDAAYALTKLKEDTRRVSAEILKVEKDTEAATKNIFLSTLSGWKAQAELYRDYGVRTYGVTTLADIVPEAAYLDYGIKTETIKKAKADIYQGYASGYRTNGYVSVALNADGSIAETTAGDTNGLTYKQTLVAVRQEQAFDDNMRQHVVNSSASLMSTLLATEASGIDYSPYLLKWTTAVDYLNTTTP